MRIANPSGIYNGMRPENVFIAMDEAGTQVGEGHIIYQHLPHRSPECPVNMYFEINSLPSGWYLLLGALVARARQLRDQAQSQQARLYTHLQPQQTEMIKQYRESGFDCDQHESMFQIYLPQGEGRVPMSCSIRQTPINTRQEQQMLVDRLRRNDITHIDVNYLQQLIRFQHFRALGLVQDNSLLGQVILAGSGVCCEVVAIYIDPVFRRQGMGRLLLHRSMAVVAAQGVTQFGGTFFTFSQPQRRLVAEFNGAERRVLGVFPQLLL